RGPFFDSNGVEDGSGNTGVERFIDSLRFWHRVEVVVADVDSIFTGIRSAGHRRRVCEWLVGIGSRRKNSHRSRAKRRARSEKLEFSCTGAQNPAVELTGISIETSGDVTGSYQAAHCARHDGVEFPGVATIERKIDRCQSAASGIRRKRRSDNLIRVGWVDSQMWLAILCSLAAERFGNHIHQQESYGTESDRTFSSFLLAGARRAWRRFL